jgi:tRNA pseudouridine38-40 synthase
MEHGVRLTLAYDGTNFAGFQRQAEGRTIQGVLEEALARIAQHPVVIRGASRTDAGVHAEGQVAAFTTTRELEPRRWVLAINRYLPDDVAVQAATSCATDYNPRYDALDKTYRYLFYFGLARHPLWAPRVWHLGREVARARRIETRTGVATTALDFEAMQRTAASMLGRHDFRAFRASDDVRERSERTLHSIELVRNFQSHPDLVALEVRGDAFMKNMVRVIAGTLVAVGRGRLTPDQVRALLQPGQIRNPYSETAPPQGLTLVRMTLGRKAAAQSSGALT